MEQGLTGVESRRCSAPSRGKAAARVVRRVGGWREQGVSVGLKGRPGSRAGALKKETGEVSGGDRGFRCVRAARGRG